MYTLWIYAYSMLRHKILIVPVTKTVYCLLIFPKIFDALQIKVPVSVIFIFNTNFSVVADICIVSLVIPCENQMEYFQVI